MGAGGEVLVAASAAPAPGDHELLVGLTEVVNQLSGLLVVEACTDRDLQNNRVAVQAGAIRAHAVFAALRLVLRVVAEMDEGIVALRASHYDIAATAAVSSTRTAAGNELLAPEGHAAVTAVAGFDANFCFIDEHGLPGSGVRDRKSALRKLEIELEGLHAG